MSDRNIHTLDQYWDGWLAGASDASALIDTEIAEVVSRLHSAQDVDGIDPALVLRLWNELMRTEPSSAPLSDPGAQKWEKPMNLAAVTREISPTQSTYVPSRRNWRVLSRSAPAGPIPESMTALPRSVARRGFAYRAIAALVILAIVLGYFAFEPLRRGSDTPRFVPGGVAPVGTPATAEPSPTIVTYSMEGHPIIGIWLVDYSDNPGSDTKVYSFGEDGKYSNTNNHQLPRVTMGEWRATGERTLELVCIEQMIYLHDLWDPESETIPYVLDTKVQFWRLSITVDETGNSFTGTGGYIYYNGDGAVIYPYRELQVIGTRLDVAALGTEDTPVP